MKGNINDILIPHVNKLPSNKKVETKNLLKGNEKSEFNNLLNKKISDHQIKLSSHAMKRLEERNIDFNSEEYSKVKSALDKLREKGSKESLVITGKAAYIVDVNKGRIITAVDKGSMNENVFTKIDSTIIT